MIAELRQAVGGLVSVAASVIWATGMGVLIVLVLCAVGVKRKLARDAW